MLGASKQPYDQAGAELQSLVREHLKPYLLTVREAQIVDLLTRGFSNKEIAARCYISEQTVKDHLKHAYRKIGIHQRSALMAWLFGRGAEPEGLAAISGRG